MTVHANSILAFEALDLNKREALVLSAYILAGCALTDRQVMARLGFSEPNCVRPRCTSLAERGYLAEVDRVLCPVTGHRVRRMVPTSIARVDQRQLVLDDVLL